MKQGTFAELESDKTGEEQHRRTATSLMKPTTAIRKSGSVVSLLQIQPVAFFFINRYFFWNLAQKFLRLRKSTSPVPHSPLFKVLAFHSCGRAMPGPDLATCMVLRQLMKQALRLLLPAFVLSYKLPYKESYCYKAGK